MGNHKIGGFRAQAKAEAEAEVESEIVKKWKSLTFDKNSSRLESNLTEIIKKSNYRELKKEANFFPSRKLSFPKVHLFLLPTSSSSFA